MILYFGLSRYREFGPPQSDLEVFGLLDFYHRKASEHLSNYSENELRTIVFELDRLDTQLKYQRWDQHRQGQEDYLPQITMGDPLEGLTYPEELDRHDASFPTLLFEMHEELEQAGSIDLSFASWADYFGALGLSYLGIASLAKENFKDNIQAEINAHLQAQQSFDFMQAFLLTNRTKRKLAIKAANARHAKTNRIKSQFISFYLNGKHKSRANAAKRFFDQLSEAERKLFSLDNAERTLLDALRKHEKQQM